MGGFLGQFFPAESRAVTFSRLALKATLETLAMATAASRSHMLLALPLGLALTHSAVGLTHRSRARPRPGAALRALARMALLVLRGIPELVWALLLVRAFGLGPAAGVLAHGADLRRHAGQGLFGNSGSGDTRPARVLLESGSGRLMAFFYGLLPERRRSWPPTPSIVGSAPCAPR